MNQIRKNTGRPFALLLTVCITFLLFAVVAPSEKNSPNITAINKISRMSDAQTSAQRFGRTYFLTTLSGNEIISEIEINLLTDRHIRDFRGFNFRFNKLLLPFISIGVLVLCFGYVIIRNEQNKSILTIRLGGHAPPEGPLVKYA